VIEPKPITMGWLTTQPAECRYTTLSKVLRGDVDASIKVGIEFISAGAAFEYGLGTAVRTMDIATARTPLRSIARVYSHAQNGTDIFTGVILILIPIFPLVSPLKNRKENNNVQRSQG